MLSFFKSNILKFIQPNPNCIYICHNPKWIRLIDRLCLGLSHLHEPEFKYSFQDCLNPLWLCGDDIDTSSHFLLHCPNCSNERMTLLKKTKNVNYGILELNETIIIKTLLIGDSSLSDSTNSLILNSSIEYVIATKKFDGQIAT